MGAAGDRGPRHRRRNDPVAPAAERAKARASSSAGRTSRSSSASALIVSLFEDTEHKIVGVLGVIGRTRPSTIARLDPHGLRHGAPARPASSLDFQDVMPSIQRGSGDPIVQQSQRLTKILNRAPRIRRPTAAADAQGSTIQLGQRRVERGRCSATPICANGCSAPWRKR